jgi:methylmalonyl-CoA mutase N-terminal domain/subunit
MAAFAVAPALRHATIWARASVRCWSAIDPELNLNRAALQTFAAMVAGCAVLEPLLHDPLPGPAESLRLAANQHRLLLHEAGVGATPDPASGSFAIEALTAQIATSAWAMLQARERGDGVATPAPAGAEVLVGTNRFADPDARITSPLPTPRPAAAYETLRRRTKASPVAAVVVPFGETRAARAATEWATELLRTAGIEPQVTAPCATPAQVVEQLSAHAAARVVVLAGASDPTGSFLRPACAARHGDPRRPLLYATGEPPPGSETWGAIGFLHRRLDPVGTLGGILDRIGVSPV